MRKTLMLGLDGVTFSILNPAFDAGHMPKLNGASLHAARLDVDLHRSQSR